MTKSRLLYLFAQLNTEYQRWSIKWKGNPNLLRLATVFDLESAAFYVDFVDFRCVTPNPVDADIVVI